MVVVIEFRIFYRIGLRKCCSLRDRKRAVRMHAVGVGRVYRLACKESTADESRVPPGTQVALENGIVENSLPERTELRRPLYSGRRNFCSLLNSFPKKVQVDYSRGPCPVSEFLPSRKPCSPLPWSSRGVRRRRSARQPQQQHHAASQNGWPARRLI